MRWSDAAGQVVTPLLSIAAGLAAFGLVGLARQFARRAWGW